MIFFNPYYPPLHADINIQPIVEKFSSLSRFHQVEQQRTIQAALEILKNPEPENVSNESPLFFANGDMYFGETFENQPQGKGSFLTAHDDLYEGDFDQGIFNEGSIRFADGDRFNGKRIQDKFFTGTMKFENGDSFTGTLFGKIPHGIGRMTYQNGPIAEFYGTMMMGFPDDFGVFLYRNGTWYTGFLYNDKPEGLGLAFYPKIGVKIVGNFKAGKPFGLATVYYPDNSVFTADFGDQFAKGTSITSLGFQSAAFLSAEDLALFQL